MVCAMRFAFLAFVLQGALAGSAFAQAEEPPPGGVSPDDDARARRLFLVGDGLYAQGRYEEAIATFEEAYALSPRPLLLFNLANAQERAGRWADARDSLARYLPDAPEGERAAIAQRIESLDRRLERVARLRDDPEASDEATPEPDAPAPEDDGPDALGLGLTVTAGAVLATGAVLGGLALGARADVRSACQDGLDGGRVCPESVATDADRDRALSLGADVLLGVGAVALGVGLYFLLRSESDDDDTVAPAAAASPEGGWVGVRGRF